MEGRLQEVRPGGALGNSFCPDACGGQWAHVAPTGSAAAASAVTSSWCFCQGHSLLPPPRLQFSWFNTAQSNGNINADHKYESHLQ